MLETLRCVLGLCLMSVSVLGYGFHPPPEYIGSEKAITSICLYYSILAMLLFVETLCNLINAKYLRMFEILFIALLLAIVLFGVRILVRIWNFKVERVRDILIYGSVIYLMDKVVFSSITCRISMNVVLLVLAIWVVSLSGYVLLKFKRLRPFIVFESYELVSIVYITTFLIGMCATNENLAKTLPYTLAVTLNIYALYVIIHKYIKPLV